MQPADGLFRRPGFVLSVGDRVLVLDFGHLIAEGTPDEIRAAQKVIDAYLWAHTG